MNHILYHYYYQQQYLSQVSWVFSSAGVRDRGFFRFSSRCCPKYLQIQLGWLHPPSTLLSSGFHNNNNNNNDNKISNDISHNNNNNINCPKLPLFAFPKNPVARDYSVSAVDDAVICATPGAQRLRVHKPGSPVLREQQIAVRAAAVQFKTAAYFS